MKVIDKEFDKTKENSGKALVEINKKGQKNSKKGCKALIIVSVIGILTIGLTVVIIYLGASSSSSGKDNNSGTNSTKTTLLF